MSVSILRLPEVKRRTGLSTSTIYRMMREGTFPKPIKIGRLRSVGWIDSEVSQFISQRIEATQSADIELE